MSKLNGWKKDAALILVCLATAIAADAQTFTSLVDFDGTNGDAPLYMSLIQGADGDYYGTTAYGGNGGGTVFRIGQDGTMTVLYNFCQESCIDGNYPSAGLVLAMNGKFYGTTYAGGNDNGGVVFRITSAGAFMDLYSFCFNEKCINSPASPQDPLIQGTDGNLYGTSVNGGRYGYRCDSHSGCGTLFRMTLQGSVTGVYSFCGQPQCTDSDFPVAGLLQGSDGNFYGTTTGGGVDGSGTVFKITPKGKLTTLYRFCSLTGCSDGALPYGKLIQAQDGNFYGTTSQGGNSDSLCVGGCGTVFKITPHGTLTTIYSFCAQPSCADGYSPEAGLIQGTDQNFYGTTLLGGGDLVDCTNGANGCGTAFQITSEGALVTLHSFSNNDGAYPAGGLLQGTNGLFYGVTTNGGDLDCVYGEHGCGTVFSLDLGLGPFVTFVLAAGKVGQTGGILGQGFTGTTSVAINGIQAHFAVVSDTYIKATVPQGATTGYVTVTTPTGVLTSNVPFRVIH